MKDSLFYNLIIVTVLITFAGSFAIFYTTVEKIVELKNTNDCISTVSDKDLCFQMNASIALFIFGIVSFAVIYIHQINLLKKHSSKF